MLRTGGGHVPGKCVLIAREVSLCCGLGERPGRLGAERSILLLHALASKGCGVGDMLQLFAGAEHP